jgi:hypothetical protein
VARVLPPVTDSNLPFCSTDKFLDTLQSIINGEAPPRQGTSSAAGGEDASADAAAAAAALDASLDSHFHAIQELSSMQVLEDLPGRLRQALMEVRGGAAAACTTICHLPSVQERRGFTMARLACRPPTA